MRTSCLTGRLLVEEPHVPLESLLFDPKAPLITERAGNSVEVLLTRYAKCLYGRQDVANRRIEDLLCEYE